MPTKTSLPRSGSRILSEHVSEDNPLRVIDALIFRQMGNLHVWHARIHAKALLKVYLYGYFSKKIEHQTNKLSY